MHTLYQIRTALLLSTNIGSPLLYVTSHVWLWGDNHEEDRSPPYCHFLASIGRKVWLCDSARLQSIRAGFCQVCTVFMISIAQEWRHLAVMRIHKQKQRNKTTGYIELIAPKAGCFDLWFVESFVRIAHILPPTSHTMRSVVQDLYNSDMYLQLCHVQ